MGGWTMRTRCWWAAVVVLGGVGCGDDGGGTGGGSGGGASSASTTATTTTSSSAASTGAGGEGGAACVGELEIDDEDWVECMATSCCAELDACTSARADQQACVDCLLRGSGDPRCNDLMICDAANGCGPTTLCGSNVPWPVPEAPIACLEESCCDAFMACSEDGADPSGCLECLVAGGGERCDAAIACAQEECEATTTTICDSGLISSTEDFNACLTANCCAEFNACSTDGTTVAACAECLNGGGGKGCGDAHGCALQHCVPNVAPFCDSGFAFNDPDPLQEQIAACASENCCEAWNDCTGGATEVQECLDCLNGGGGKSCSDVIQCMAGNDCDPNLAGFCDSGIGFFNPPPSMLDLVECVSRSCCEEANACTLRGADVARCGVCLGEGGGEACDALDDCAEQACGRGLVLTEVCDSGFTIPGEEAAACAGESCCAEFTACVADCNEACGECLTAGGGEPCDAVIECMTASCDGEL